jgi:FKBP-type peptidyl-prolyl cis-trans isomerase (trigger factor)
MDPNLKLVLDELNRRFDAQDQKWESRFSNLERVHSARASEVDQRVAALESLAAVVESDRAELAKADVPARLAHLEAAYGGQYDDVYMRLSALESIRVDAMFAETVDRVAVLETAATDLGTWRPEVEALVDDLKLEVQKIAQTWGQASPSSAPPPPGFLLHPAAAGPGILGNPSSATGRASACRSIRR